MIEFQCLGGFREVGSNAVFVRGNKNYMFDFGLAVESGRPPLMPQGRTDALFVTHGHLDHLGSAPTLYRRDKCEIYATKPTREFSELLLNDAIKVARLKGLNREYNKVDVNKALIHFKNVVYNQPVKFGFESVTAMSAGHTPGSASFLLKTKGKNILYTGDFKVESTPLIDGANFSGINNLDIAIMETTYSSRDHPPRAKVEKEMFTTVKNTINNGGIALIPSFSSRAADILMVLYKNRADFPIYLDGMAKAAVEITLNNPKFVRNSVELKKALSKVHSIRKHTERSNVLEQPCAIVTTGGCLDGGPIVEYLKRIYMRDDCSLVLTGFQIPGTAGRYLLDTGRYVTQEMDMKLKMPIYQYDMSGHAGRKELLNFVNKLRPKTVICMHGDYCEKFATELRGRFNVEAIAPKNGEVLKL